MTSSAENPTAKEQIRSGVRRAAAALLGMGWFGVVLWGITESFGSEADFNIGHHPRRILGYCLLTIAGAGFALAANRWKRYFPGIMIFATIGSLRLLWYGRNPSDSSIFPRSTALVYVFVIAGVMLMSFSFKKRNLNLLDRMALLAFAASILWTAVEKQFYTLAPIVGAGCVLLAWAHDRIRSGTGAAGQSQ